MSQCEAAVWCGGTSKILPGGEEEIGGIGEIRWTQMKVDGTRQIILEAADSEKLGKRGACGDNH
jgi:hypothetical protein